MSILRRTTLIVALCFAVLAMVQALVFRFVLMESFASLEEQAVRTDVERVLSALDLRLLSLQATNTDYAFWDDTAAFVAGRYEEYAEYNLADASLANIGVNLAGFFDEEGRLVYAKPLDLDPQEAQAILSALQEATDPWSSLVRHRDIASRVLGVVPLAEGLLLVSSVPVLDSLAQEPVRGALLMGAFLSFNGLEDLKEQTRLEFQLYRSDDTALPADLQGAQELLSAQTPVVVQTLGDQVVAGYTRIPDLFGRPSVLLRLESPRNIYRQGLRTLRYQVLSVFLTGLTLSLVVLALLHGSILARLLKLTRKIEQIRAGGTPGDRIPPLGTDEIGSLVDTLNGMLESLAQTSAAVLREKEAAQAASRAKSAFLATMSHELRTPLNHIIGFTELVLRGKVGALNERQEEHLRDVLEGGRHLLHMINELLDLSKAEAGRIQLKLEHIDPRAVLENSVRTVQEAARRCGVTVSGDLEHLPPAVRVDERILKQVMDNLLSNAVKFTPAGGAVRVSARTRTSEDGSEWVAISVADTGVGIKPEELQGLFTPFQQLGNEVRPAAAGTGLGLSITRRFVELHGGTIQAESAGPGKGSTFGFTIPAAGPPPAGPDGRDWPGVSGLL